TVLALIAFAPAAHAFTVDDGSGKPANGAAKNANQTSPFYDSSKKYDLETKDDPGTFKFNGGSVNFGPVRSPDDGYRRGVDRMFNPLARRANWAASLPPQPAGEILEIDSDLLGAAERSFEPGDALSRKFARHRSRRFRDHLNHRRVLEADRAHHRF